MKKSDMPFGRKSCKVAVLCKNPQLYGNSLYLGQGIHVNSAQGLAGSLEILKIVSESEAIKYQALFELCLKAPISTTQNVERSHRREDGTEKRGFKETNFQLALYQLKLLYPDCDCMAYICPECNMIHLGKGAKQEFFFDL